VALGLLYLPGRLFRCVQGRLRGGELALRPLERRRRVAVLRVLIEAGHDLGQALRYLLQTLAGLLGPAVALAPAADGLSDALGVAGRLVELAAELAHRSGQGQGAPTTLDGLVDVHGRGRARAGLAQPRAQVLPAACFVEGEFDPPLLDPGGAEECRVAHPQDFAEPRVDVLRAVGERRVRGEVDERGLALRLREGLRHAVARAPGFELDRDLRRGLRPPRYPAADLRLARRGGRLEEGGAEGLEEG
jgi:hypothetical protein